MKTLKAKLNGKLILAAIILILAISSLPATAFELTLATGDTMTTGYDSQNVQQGTISHQTQRSRSLKDLFEIPQP